MKLVENIPLDTDIIAEMIGEPEDLRLVWPAARYPFDHRQWVEVLDPEKGNVPFLVVEGDKVIGHAALRKADEPHVYSINYLFILPHLRDRGSGMKIIGLMEEYARDRLSAEKLILVVRSYNPRALNCYTKCGFREYRREGTVIRMSKKLTDKGPPAGMDD
jgi:RimJ/RimL family protein N-acetyltransferase